MNKDKWRKLIKNRSDMVTRITHLTKGDTDDEAFERLWKIVNDQVLIGGDGYITSNEKVVCFQDVPLVSIAETLQYEQSIGCNRHKEFGLRFFKRQIYDKGGRPVIYGDSIELKEMLPEAKHWLIVSFNLSEDDIVDWTHEREWRIKGDFHFSDLKFGVILKNNQYLHRFIEKCINEDKLDLLLKVNELTTIDSMLQ